MVMAMIDERGEVGGTGKKENEPFVIAGSREGVVMVEERKSDWCRGIQDLFSEILYFFFFFSLIT